MSTATQTVHPWRAAVRTFVQTFVPILVLGVIALPEVVEVIDAEAGAMLPEHARAWLLGLGTIASVLAAIGARVMALESVTGVLQRVKGLGWLAPEPAPARHADLDGDGIADHAQGHPRDNGAP